MISAIFNKTDFPLVSVAIPCYNASKTIAESIDSVLNQTYKNIEIIVVDDGSFDETKSILDNYKQCITIVSQENSGLACARNAALRVAKGKYIALLDADDICLPERIEIQVKCMEKNENIVLCSTDFTSFYSECIICDSCISSYYTIISKIPDGISGIYDNSQSVLINSKKILLYYGKIYEFLSLGNFIHPPTVLFRKDLLPQSGFFDENIKNCCDFDWFIRVSRIGEMGYIDRSLLKYRISDTQMSGPLNYTQAALDTVSIIEKLILNDPELYARNRKLFRERLGVYYLLVANNLADDHFFNPLKKLYCSLMFGECSLLSLKVALKIFLPKWVTNLWRNL